MNATQYNSAGHTASGRTFDGFSAAHKTLPFGTRVKVTNPRTGASTIVTIIDRGPFTRGRDIDLSRGAARAIGLSSVGKVCTEIL
jgi:rare lipoprotein A